MLGQLTNPLKAISLNKGIFLSRCMYVLRFHMRVIEKAVTS